MSDLQTPAAAAPVANPLLRAIELQNQGRIAEATGLFREVLAVRPNDPVALYSLAGILMQQNAHDEVLRLTERGITHTPDFAPMWFARALALQAVGRREEALRAYDRAIALKPDYSECLLNSGALLREMNRHIDAVERFQRLLAINPKHESALGNCGILLSEFKRSDEAIAMFERLLAINPDYPYGKGLLCYERLHVCDWTNYPALSAEVIDGLRDGKKTCKSLGLMAISDSASDHQQAARIFAAQWFPKPAAALWNGERYKHRRLRIAYVSPDLREHPVGHLMAGVIERHDKTRFETIGISLGVDDGSRIRARMQRAFDRFIDARRQTPLETARLMREMEIDVAIDLAGFTSDSRCGIFAHRPAPVQVNYLGYPGTMATGYHDYILADRHVIPPEHQAFYTEQIAYLPDTYLPTDRGLQISEHTPSRTECGLPESGTVFCSFSHDYKINPALFDVWMRILRRTPGSVLWLVARNAQTRANLQREAAARGVEPSRLVFAERVPRVEDHLARYRLANVFLDTSPYNAHTTAADALMAGLPVITCSGNAFPSRVAGSLLRAIGLPELVAESFEGYEALAIELAQHPLRLHDLKARLLANQTTHALFDTERFCRNLEAALVDMAVRTGATTLTADAPEAPPAPPPAPRRLHIGGKLRVNGWEVMNALPGDHVDHLGNANDLSRFADDTFDVVYASHVVEHFDYRDELGKTLREWCRALKPGGWVLISVPDLEVLASLILDKTLSVNERFMTMRMMFGGHVDAYDYHGVGLTAEFLTAFLSEAGFVGMERVERFGFFADTSNYRFAGRQISLNLRAMKPLR